MFYKTILSLMVALAFTTSHAEEVQIVGNVASKCTIHTDSAGRYANPTADVLSTDSLDGGSPAIIRYDVVSANTYKAVITVPNSFSTSPVLSDTLAWSGDVSVHEVTDPNMSAYDSNKQVYDNVTEIDLSVAGIVWFKAGSKVEYGFNKSLPGGTYRSVVIAECIAL